MANSGAWFLHHPFCDAEEFESHIRSLHRAGRMGGGPCVLDSAAGNAMLFPGMSSSRMFHRDVCVALPPGAAQQALRLCESELNIEAAFQMRRELVNFKKVCLHLAQEAQQLLAELKRLCSFFFCDMVGSGAQLEDRQRYRQLSGLFQESKALMTVVFDVRNVAKGLCSLPRHPLQFAPAACLLNMPGSLQAVGLYARARAFASLQAPTTEPCSHPASLYQAPDTTSTYAATEPSTRLPVAISQCSLSDAASRAPLVAETKLGATPHALPTTLGGDPGCLVRAELRLREVGWPAHLIRFVVMSLTARGVFKVVEMRRWLGRALEAFGHLHRNLLQTSQLFPADTDPGSGSGGSVRDQIHLHMHVSVLAAAAQGTKDAIAWLRAIVELGGAGTCITSLSHNSIETGAFLKDTFNVRTLPSNNDSNANKRALVALDKPACASGTMFVAGDCARSGRTAMFLPRGFLLPRMLASVRARLVEHHERMRRDLRAGAWPPAHRWPVTQSAEAMAGPSKLYSCKVCKLQFRGKVWLDRNVCWRCERGLREQGRCPFGRRCGSEAVCPHSGMCFVCDKWSCEECLFMRGDGEAVAALVESTAAAAVLLEFDRTLASTRSGACPEPGATAVDPELLGLLQWHPKVTVVTRNQHHDDMTELLRGLGANPSVRVLCVGKHAGASKAEVVCSEVLRLDAERAGPVMASGGAKREMAVVGFKGQGEASEEAADCGAVVLVDDDIQELVHPSVQALGSRLHRVLFVRGL